MSTLTKGGQRIDLSNHAPQACQPCRRLKRKCTKELPSCSLCLRLGKACDYAARSDEVSIDTQLLLDKIQELEQQTERVAPASGEGLLPKYSSFARLLDTPPIISPIPSTQNKQFPSNLYLLDSESFQKLPANVLDPGMRVPAEVLHLLGSSDELQSMCAAYFNTVNTWCRILSQKRLLDRLEKFDPEAEATTALLLLSMKLVTQILSETEEPRTHLYWTCRQFYSQVEDAPLLSLALLQAKLLIAVYEIGHGIYPAAFLSVGHAARLGHMIGLHDSKKAPQLFRAPSSWTLREEERRVWWEVVVMDRIVNLGTNWTPLVTGEPKNNELLPCDDLPWDNGSISYSGPLFGPSHSGANYSTTAQMCQAAHLLGQVHRHRSDRQSEPSFRLNEAMQLNRTLIALDSMTQAPSSREGAEYPDCAIAICCSARFLLYERYACMENDYEGFPTGQEAEVQKQSLFGIEQCVERMYQLALRLLGREKSSDLHTGSILVIHALYWACSECRWYVKEGKLGALGLIETMVDALRILNRRWHRAGDYLKLLEREEAMED